MGGHVLSNGHVLQTDEYVEHLEAQNDHLREALKQAIRVIRTWEAVSSELHDALREAVEK